MNWLEALPTIPGLRSGNGNGQEFRLKI